jgi:aminopeptidase N
MRVLPRKWRLLSALIGCAVSVDCQRSVVATDDSAPRAQLPAAVTPTRYDLELEIDPRRPTFSGIATIDVDVHERAHTIWLHGLGLHVSASSFEQHGRSIPLTYTAVDEQTGVARVDAREPIEPRPGRLRIVYTAPFSESAQGLFRLQLGQDWYVFSQMQPIDARRVFPSFDEPRFKTPVAMTVVAPRADVVIANALPAGEEPRKNGTVRHRFAPTPPLPTYLLALAVGPLDVVTAPDVPANAIRGSPLPMRGIATRGQGRRLAFALRETPELIRHLEEYFGIPYPYSKLDIISSPAVSGAMENAGAILFSDTLLLFDDDALSARQRVFGVVAAHEYAHQWFGNLVTPRWWDDIWLNEAFASWMGFKASNIWRPDLTLWSDLTLNALDAMTLDAQSAGRAIHQQVHDTRHISSTFDAITYAKGAGVLAMVESYVGAETFRRGVQGFLAARPHGVATSEDFFQSMAAAANQPQVIQAFRSFTDQPGVPLITVAASSDGRSLRLSQSRYRPLGSSLTADGSWLVPFCASVYRVGQAANPAKVCTLVAQATAELAIPHGLEVGAVMPNAGGVGYYRFAVEPAALDQLLARAPWLPTGEALALADSVLAGFKSGSIPFERLLTSAARLASHPDRDASTKLGLDLVTLGNRLLGPVQRAELQRRLSTIYMPQMRRAGFNARTGAYPAERAETALRRATLARILALGARDTRVRSLLRQAVAAATRDPRALDVGLRDVAWAVAAQDEPDAHREALASIVLTSEDPVAREHAAFALGAIEDPNAAAAVRTLIADERVRLREMFSILATQFSSPATRDGAWRWFASNFAATFERVPAFGHGFMLGLPGVMCESAQRADVETRLAPHVRQTGTGELALARALESIDLCVAQKKEHGRHIVAVLAD